MDNAKIVDGYKISRIEVHITSDARRTQHLKAEWMDESTPYALIHESLIPDFITWLDPPGSGFFTIGDAGLELVILDYWPDRGAYLVANISLPAWRDNPVPIPEPLFGCLKCGDEKGD